ncbi:MAG: SO_0444 family Cu/Zn efflux transporter [Candidatus Zapsychrus exili]|nr:SO_0444 family Cu/Zn efflux transporter [Candidatus Zapsychrus exili]
MNIILDILRESYFLLNKMSVYLLFGFLVAGIIHIFLKTETIAKHLGKNKLSSVIKASLFGIPLPLCSCGVIPAALSLKRDGASKGAILSFLISTPTTGIDSIFATYGILGGIFTIYRIIASFVAGVFAGVLANIFFKGEDSPLSETAPILNKPKACCSHHQEHQHNIESIASKIKGVFKYAFVDLLKDVGPWVLIGILVAGVISYFIPDTFITNYLSSTWKSMFIMLLIGMPMYVCSSGSLPIAAALMLKGLNPGAAFVFLLSGPATNSAALTVIAKELGVKAAAIFVSSIIISSLFLGYILNIIWQYFDINITHHIMSHSQILPAWVSAISTIVLLVGILINILSNNRK